MLKQLKAITIQTFEDSVVTQHSNDPLAIEVYRKNSMFNFCISLLPTVTRLREQWDETSNCVMKRKSELVAMLGDSQRLLFISHLSAASLDSSERDFRDKN